MISRIKAWIARNVVVKTLERSAVLVERSQERTANELQHLESIISEIDHIRAEAAQVAEEYHDRMTTLRERMEGRLDQLFDQVDVSKRTIESQNSTIDGLRQELQVANDVTIPALVASNRLVLERIEADTAIQIRTRVASAPVEGTPN